MESSQVIICKVLIHSLLFHRVLLNKSFRFQPAILKVSRVLIRGGYREWIADYVPPNRRLITFEANFHSFGPSSSNQLAVYLHLLLQRWIPSVSCFSAWLFDSVMFFAIMRLLDGFTNAILDFARKSYWFTVHTISLVQGSSHWTKWRPRKRESLTTGGVEKSNILNH